MVGAFCVNVPRRWRMALWGLAAVIVPAGMVMADRDDGVLLARGGPHLILAGATGSAVPFARQEQAGRSLSGFLQDSVARHLAQPVGQTAGDVTRNLAADGIFGHQLRDGRRVTIITSRRALSAGCRQAEEIVIALVKADYPCRSGVPLVSLAGLPRDNYRLTVATGHVMARATDGQYLRINPVSRP